MITADRLREVLDYDPETGVFIWIMSKQGVSFGKAAGAMKARGYRAVQIDGRDYAEHRLVWLWMTGQWPRDQIDHINRDRADNRWCNLREATQSQNFANRTALSTNKTGLKGAHYEAGRQQWRVTIMKEGVRHFIGRYACPAAAHFAYIIAADKLNGEFARA